MKFKKLKVGDKFIPRQTNEGCHYMKINEDTGICLQSNEPECPPANRVSFSKKLEVDRFVYTGMHRMDD
jgi:hypothetical protein